MAKPDTRFPPDVPVPATYDEAMRSLRDRDWVAGRQFEAQQMRPNREGAHPDLLIFERRFIKRMAGLGMPLYPHTVIRTMDEQARVYAEGHSKAKPGESAHNYGMAVDIVHGQRHWNLSEREWLLVGHIGKEVAKSCGVKLVWGGNDGPGDKFNWDPAHWHIHGWRKLVGRYPFPDTGGLLLSAFDKHGKSPS
jgi:hypothetical protein